MVRVKTLELIEANRHGQQLFLANIFHRRRRHDQQNRPEAPSAARRLEQAEVPCPVGHRQLVLFGAERDLRSRGIAELPAPAIPELAAYLEARACEQAARHGWSLSSTRKVRYGIRVLLALQDIPGAAITAGEVTMLRGCKLPMRPITQVLSQAGFLDDDRVPAIASWFDNQITGLPEPMADELRIWFEVMLHGSRTPPRRLPRSVITIRLHLRWALPILRAWADQGHGSLREISRDDVRAALPASGNPRATTGQGLRSIFRLLKARKVIFVDPTARISTGYAAPSEPLPIDLDELRAALNSPDPARAVVVALVTFCGLRNGHLRTLLVTDVRDGRLHLDGRVIVLADLVRTRLAAYLDYRNARWPHTANPHLFLTQRTATRTDAAGRRWIRLKAGVAGAVQAIREDRILHEAHATGGDARQLCDLFGISITAAERYIATLDHPDLVSLETARPARGDTTRGVTAAKKNFPGTPTYPCGDR